MKSKTKKIRNKLSRDGRSRTGKVTKKKKKKKKGKVEEFLNGPIGVPRTKPGHRVAASLAFIGSRGSARSGFDPRNSW